MTEVEELLMRIRGLVFAQAILEERGASASELEAHRLETERLRQRLAVVVANGANGAVTPLPARGPAGSAAGTAP
jgi:hypothetical protein